MPVIRADKFDLEYTDTGSGPAVVLVHSSASGHRQWRRLAEALPGYRLIAVNLFGYGETSAWPGTRPLTAADQAELVLAAAALAPEPVVLVGHSLGGAVAFEAAAQLGRRLRGLIAFEPILFGHLQANGPQDAFAEIANVARRYNELAATGDWHAVGEWFIDYWSGAGAWAAMREERKQATIAMLPPVVHEWDMAISGIRPLAGWSAIAAPVHLIGAADTRAPTREIMKLLARTYPGWQVHELPAGGHMAPVARADLVNPVIGAALERMKD